MRKVPNPDKPKPKGQKRKASLAMAYERKAATERFRKGRKGRLNPRFSEKPKALLLSHIASFEKKFSPNQSFDVPNRPEGLNKSTSRNRTNTMTSFQPEPR